MVEERVAETLPGDRVWPNTVLLNRRLKVERYRKMLEGSTGKDEASVRPTRPASAGDCPRQVSLAWKREWRAEKG